MVEKRYSVEQAAEISGRSTRTIYRDIYSGDLPASKCGRNWRIKESDLERYCTAGRMTRFEQLRAGIIDSRPQLSSNEKMALVSLLVGGEADNA